MATEELFDVSHPSYKSKMSKFTRKNDALDSLVDTLDLSNDDERFWWDASSGILAAFLANVGSYDKQLQTHFLQFYRNVISGLHPRPLADGSAPHYSVFAVDFTPVEFSWNYDGAKSIIRIGFEPYGLSADDPFGQTRARMLVNEAALMSSTKLVDLELFDAIAEVMWISPENAPRVLDQLPKDPKKERPYHIIMGFNLLHDGSITVKASVTTMVKRYETSPCRAGGRISGELIRLLDSKFYSTASILPAYKIIEDFDDSCPENSKQRVFMLSWDCMKPLDSRLKIYVFKEKTSLKNLRDIWTQGGRLKGREIDRGLELIDELWSMCYCAPNDIPAKQELKNRLGESEPIMACLEIRPGATQPAPKLYLPVAKFGQNDLELVTDLTRLFDTRGWPLGRTLVDDFQEIYSHLNMGETKGMLTFLSISVPEGGDLRVTMYTTPLIFSSLSEGL